MDDVELLVLLYFGTPTLVVVAGLWNGWLLRPRGDNTGK
jgi:hypothetical protein